MSDGLLILIGGPVISDSTASRPQLEEDASTGGIGRWQQGRDTLIGYFFVGDLFFSFFFFLNIVMLILQDVEELMGLAPEKILLKWMNFHLQKAGYKKTVTNFSSDVKVR